MYADVVAELIGARILKVFYRAMHSLLFKKNSCLLGTCWREESTVYLFNGFHSEERGWCLFSCIRQLCHQYFSTYNLLTPQMKYFFLLFVRIVVAVVPNLYATSRDKLVHLLRTWIDHRLFTVSILDTIQTGISRTIGILSIPHFFSLSNTRFSISPSHHQSHPKLLWRLLLIMAVCHILHTPLAPLQY
jgi:hypothetical protein